MNLEEATEYEVTNGWLGWLFNFRLTHEWVSSYYTKMAIKKYNRWRECKSVESGLTKVFSKKKN